MSQSEDITGFIKNTKSRKKPMRRAVGTDARTQDPAGL